MDCCCEMEHYTTASRRIIVNASQVMLKEKHRRAHEFGKYLEQHPDTNTPLCIELKRATCLYRMALSNVIKEIEEKNAPKKRNKG